MKVIFLLLSLSIKDSYQILTPAILGNAYTFRIKFNHTVNAPLIVSFYRGSNGVCRCLGIECFDYTENIVASLKALKGQEYEFTATIKNVTQRDENHWRLGYLGAAIFRHESPLFNNYLKVYYSKKKHNIEDPDITGMDELKGRNDTELTSFLNISETVKEESTVQTDNIVENYTIEEFPESQFGDKPIEKEQSIVIDRAEACLIAAAILFCFVIVWLIFLYKYKTTISRKIGGLRLFRKRNNKHVYCYINNAISPDSLKQRDGEKQLYVNQSVIVQSKLDGDYITPIDDRTSSHVSTGVGFAHNHSVLREMPAYLSGLLYDVENV